MTEPTDDPSAEASDGPGLTAEQERDVRRMLADARHAEPVPGDVAARLDRVLAELAAGDHASPSPVADLASHRRRRVATLLVAAAAVVAVGIGIGQVLPNGSGGDSGGSTMAEDAPAAAGADSGSLSERDTSANKDRGSSGTAPAPTYAASIPQEVSEQGFSADVRRVRSRALTRLNGVVSSPDAYQSGSAASEDLSSTSRFVCEPADWGAGVFVPVIYDGDPAVLVFRRAMGDTQVVDLFGCGSAVALRSTTLPAP